MRGYEEGVTRQRTQAPLEARKGKEANSPPEPPEGTYPANTLTLTQWNWFDFWPPETAEHMCVFKPPFCGYLLQQPQETNAAPKETEAPPGLPWLSILLNWLSGPWSLHQPLSPTIPWASSLAPSRAEGIVNPASFSVSSGVLPNAAPGTQEGTWGRWWWRPHHREEVEFWPLSYSALADPSLAAGSSFLTAN